MTVRYISSFSVGTLHGMINRAILGMICSLYPECTECYATVSTIAMLKSSVAPNAVKRWHRLYVNSKKGKLALAARYISSAFYNVALLLTSRPGDKLFYNFNNVMSLWLIDFFNRFLRRDITICCHSEMEYLANASKHHHLYKKLLSTLTRRFFNHRRHKISPGLKFIVLGDIIRKNLQPLVSDVLMQRIHSIDHPIEPIPAGFRTGSPRLDGINIGTVGILNSYKGCDIYPSLAQDLKDCNEIRFYAIGHIQCDRKPLMDSGIILPNQRDADIPDADFYKQVDALDYILLLYPTDHYRLICSGAFLESVRFQRPVIGLRTDYFSYIFEKFGPIGYLADNVEQLKEIIRRLPDHDTPRFDFNSIERALSPESLTPQLKTILNLNTQSI